MDKFGFDEVTSSAGDVQQDAVGILLTKGGMMDGTDSATARHEDEAKRIRMYIYIIIKEE